MYEQAQSKRIVTKIDANPLLQKRNAENGVFACCGLLPRFDGQ